MDRRRKTPGDAGQADRDRDRVDRRGQAAQLEISELLRQFRNYCGLIKIARCGFPWKKTTKGLSLPRISCSAALAENTDVRLSSRKVACSSVVPTRCTGNPGSVYTNCETAYRVQNVITARTANKATVAECRITCNVLGSMPWRAGRKLCVPPNMAW